MITADLVVDETKRDTKGFFRFFSGKGAIYLI
jgi:hypothetical protein